MKILGILISSSLLLGYVLFVNEPNPVYFSAPKGWPKPHYNFKGNPLTEEGILLGRHLFYDPILSRDQTISCASCHLQATGFAHVDHELSHGIENRIGTRNALSLQNLAWNESFMWDGGINHLDVQSLAPITHPMEMDASLELVIKRLTESPKYTALFQKAFPEKPISSPLVFKALSQFMVTLVSANSKYDQQKRGEYQFTTSEAKGYLLFQNHCGSCHREPLFSSTTYENNGLPVDPDLHDIGRMKITQNPADSLRFRVPTLRNIQFTFPYMHDGRFQNLNQVIKHYNSGIIPHKTLSKPLLKPMHLSADDRVDLESFLRTLTDQEFLRNSKFNYPKNNE
jgi:cytochrome c peroxidase